jgi:hypothetical protein
VAVPAVFPWTETEQVPPELRVQVVETKVTLPDPPFCEKVIVSPVTGGVKPVTVALHVEDPPVPKLPGVQVTDVAVVCLLLQVTLAEPGLPE